ncbi:MAG: prepilin-type N-terminal cleavage/methylation domain-containing protein, partial [Geobacter sp.]|nr:prepilin-type N-terminal cleavage/methylation domain-containing protein [Geobacter sp.]
MRQHGFTLVELMIVICIAGILIAIATLQFNTYVTKTNIEAQTKMLFSDLMKVRSEALFQKRARAVSITENQFIVYSSNVASGAPRETKTL